MSHYGLFLVDCEHRLHQLINRGVSKPLKKIISLPDG